MLKDKKIVVTGGGGFLGQQVMAKLKSKGVTRLFVPRQKEFDLVQYAHVERLFDQEKPDIILHLAAEVGGIGANMKNPGRFFYSNLMMGVQMMEVARQRKIEKFTAIGTICAYPKFAPIPFREEDLWNGYPEETNAPYGLAKKMLLVMSQAYRQQYGFNSIYLLPVNLYGPGDNFDPATSHVIAAIIRKCLEAIRDKKDEIVLWGTGKASREFLYVDDAADGIVAATEQYNSSDPVNLGAGQEISIKDLANTIVELTGFKGQIRWDSSKPDGQPRRCLSTDKAKRHFNFQAKTSLRDGLKKTIDWYRPHV